MKTILVLLLIGPVVGWAQSPQEKEVLQLSRKKFDWMIQKQYDSLSAVLDEGLQYVHSNGWVETKREVLEDIHSGKLNYEAIDIESATARLYPGVAIVSGRGKFQVKMNENKLTIDLSYTEVYVLSNGRWLLTSRHANRMP